MQIGLVIAFLGLCASGFGTSIWWASSVSTKMDVMIALQKAQDAINSRYDQRLVELERWRDVVDSTGSKSMVKKTEEIKGELDTLRREFDVHRATHVLKSP